EKQLKIENGKWRIVKSSERRNVRCEKKKQNQKICNGWGRWLTVNKKPGFGVRDAEFGKAIEN
ncbi:MAG: hypothetical protein ACOCWO_05210, partial [Candidatus Muiribacteriaceae bacterium]